MVPEDPGVGGTPAAAARSIPSQPSGSGCSPTPARGGRQRWHGCMSCWCASRAERTLGPVEPPATRPASRATVTPQPQNKIHYMTRRPAQTSGPSTWIIRA